MLLKTSTSLATPVLPLSIMIKFHIFPTSKLTGKAICKKIYSLPKMSIPTMLGIQVKKPTIFLRIMLSYLLKKKIEKKYGVSLLEWMEWKL